MTDRKRHRTESDEDEPSVKIKHHSRDSSKSYEKSTKTSKSHEKSKDSTKTHVKSKAMSVKVHVKSKGFSKNHDKSKKIEGRSHEKFRKSEKFHAKSKKPEKPNWNAIKKEKKELKVNRKENESKFYILACKAKKIWENLRSKKCPDDKRESLTREIYELLRGNFDKVVFAHDMSRVIQWLMKLAPQDIKESIVDELKTHMPELMESKYASFCVKYLLKEGSPKSRQAIISSLYGKVVKLASHTIASPFLHLIYSKWATPGNKAMLRQEFYGKIYCQDKESEVHGLKEIFDLTPDLKMPILSAMKTNISRILDKKLFQSSLLHSVLAEYVNFCNKEDREEVYVQIQDSILDFTVTKDGTHVAMMCFSESSNKTKKSIIKKLRGHMQKIAVHENGHTLFFAIFDTMDDTVFLNKTMIPEISMDIKGLISNEYGKKVILYLVAHREPVYFHPSDINTVKEGIIYSTSKKDVAVRIAEIRKAILPPLLEAIAGDVATWMNSSSIEMVTLAVLKSARGEEATMVFNAVTNYVCDLEKLIVEDGVEYSVIQHTGTHMVLKKLIHYDKERDQIGEVTFSSVLASKLTDQLVSSWISHNRGCFLLVLLLECGLSAVVDMTKKKLKPLAEAISSETSTGAKILYKKLFEPICV